MTNYSTQTTNISFTSDTTSIGSSNCAFYAGVNDYSTSKISLSPNPSSDVLNCTFETKMNRKLSIVDVVGKTIAFWESNLQNEIIDIKAYANGLYSPKVEENGNQYSLKFVIKKIKVSCNV